MTEETTASSFEMNLAKIRSKTKSGRLFRRIHPAIVPKPYSEVVDDSAPVTPAPVQEAPAEPEAKIPADYHLIRWRREGERHVIYRLTQEEFEAEQEAWRQREARWHAVDIDKAFADYLAIQNRPLTSEELARELPSRRRV